jgi:hypothetical protein
MDAPTRYQRGEFGDDQAVSIPMDEMYSAEEALEQVGLEHEDDGTVLLTTYPLTILFIYFSHLAPQWHLGGHGLGHRQGEGREPPEHSPISEESELEDLLRGCGLQDAAATTVAAAPRVTGELVLLARPARVAQ